MTVYICPYCLSPVFYFEKDWVEGEIRPVNVDVSCEECCVLLTRNIYKIAKCSKLPTLLVHAIKIAKKLNLSKEEKKLFFQKVIELKRKYPWWKDYKILEIALNSVL